MATPRTARAVRRDAHPSAARQRMLARRRRTVLTAVLVALAVGGWAGAGLRGGNAGASRAGPTSLALHRAEAGAHADAARPHPAAPHPAADPAPVLTADTSRCDRSADACVDLSARTTWLQQDGRVTYGPVRALPGVGQVATPTGIFHVQWKDRHHTSGEYGEPMPYAVFFAPGGIAFHQGGLHTPSHGCVHLTATSAATYYAHLPVGAEVDVF